MSALTSLNLHNELASKAIDLSAVLSFTRG